MDSAISVAVEVAKSLVAPVGRQLGYALFCNKNIRDLRGEVEKLHKTRVGLEDQRDAALYKGEVVKTSVRKWLDAAKTEEEKVQAQLQGWEIAKKSCFHGWIPNPKALYAIGRKAKKTTLSIQELHQEGTFQAIALPGVPEGVLARLPTLLPNAPMVEEAVICQTTKHVQDDVFESRASLLKLVVESLLDVNINVVGVHGPGGVGKTTLMKQLVNRIKAERLFDEVAMAIVSENVEVKNIQGELGDMLGLKFTDESVKGRAFHLRRRLESSEKKKVLIVLDDLWKELDLEKVGIPRDKGLKLLLTSRSHDVLSQKMSSLRNFSVEGLKDDETWKLFRRLVGDVADDPKMKPIAEEMVQKCSGLPIMLKALATTLKKSKFSQWEDALEQLRRSKDVYSSLELSYKNLEGEELKNLFLMCCLFGKGRLWVEDLLVYSVGLGILGGINGMKKKRERLNELISSLQASSLLLEDEDSDYVRIHDMVREVAVTIASRDRHVLVANDNFRLTELPKDKVKLSTIISFPWVNVPTLPAGLQCPQLKLFLYAATWYSSNEVPDSFFEGMPELQVLDITSVCFSSLPSSIQFLENLVTLCIDYCTVKDITIVGNLKQLQILSFRGSSISHLPKEIAELRELRSLDLSNCSKLEKIEPGVLESLTRLEELNMENGFTKWDKEDGAIEQSNARVSELNSMPGLSNLDILIPDDTLFPTVLPIENLFKYRILVGDAWDWSSDHKESRMLKLKLESRDTLLQNWVQGILPRTHDLHLDGLRGIEKSIHELSIEGFRELKHLHVRNSPSVKYVVRSLEWLPCSAFTMLESLFLENLVNLEKICHSHLAPESFCKLKVVKVKNCGQLRNLFHHYLMNAFTQLEEIDVSACDILEEIVGDIVGIVVDADEALRNAKIEMPNLQLLKLHSLPKITSLFSQVNKSLLSGVNSEITTEEELGISMALRGRCQISFPKLEALELSQLPNLEEIWCSHSPMDLDSLRSLLVKDCGKVSNIITSQSLIQLQNLESLAIESCRAVTEVFDLEGLNLEANVNLLPQLNKIELIDLPDLICLWNRTPKAVLPLRNLKSLKVMKCNSLKYLFPLSAAKALEQIKEIEVTECMMMEAIILEDNEGKATDTVVFQCLSSILLKALPNLMCFARGNYSISFPNLKKLDIERCPKMDAFSTDDYPIPSEAGEPLSEKNATMTCQSFFNQKVLLPNLEDLKLVSMVSLKMIWHMKSASEPSSFSRLMFMHVEECENLPYVFPSILTERVQNNLKRAKIYDCSSVEVIFEADASKKDCKPTGMILHELENLELAHLPKLKCVLDGDSHVILCFPSLKEIFVRGCDNLTYLLPNVSARYLLKLETIGVGECRSMREVFVNGGGGNDLTEPISFPHLTLIKIWGLNSLISFSSGSCPFDFPSLRELRIDQCDALKTFIVRPLSDERNALNHRPVGDLSSTATIGPLSPPLFDEKVEFPSLLRLYLSYMGNLLKLWEDELPLGYSFSKLNSMTIEHCNNLTSIFQSKVIGRFQNLETLRVHDCDSLVEIFQLQGETNDSTLSVPLRELQIRGLPKMKGLWDRDPHGSVTFDKLARVTAELCGNLEYLFPASVARGLVQLQKIDIMDCGAVEELVTGSVVETLVDAGAQLLFPRLTELRSRRLPNLKRLWPVNYSLEGSSLKILYAYACGNVKIFASDLPPSSEEDVNECRQALLSIEQVIPNLERLGLGSDDVLMIQDGDFPDNIFHNLEYLCLAWFEEGESSSAGFPSRFLLDRFPDLQIKLLAFSRGSFEEIFPDELSGPQGTLISYKDGYSNGGKYSKALKNLTQLSLIGLHNLRYICKEDSLAAEVLKRIECLQVISCHRLTTLFPTASDSFQNINDLYISKCDGLRHLMTPSAARCLPRLAWMTVESCEMLAQVIAANGSGEEDDDISFPNLMSLQLDCLPSLNSFSSANCNIAFPSLGTALISKCPNMKIFSEGAVSTPSLYKMDSTFYFRWCGDLNTYVRRISSYYN